MTNIDNPLKNKLLACLPEADWKRWAPQLELVHLPQGNVLYECDHQMPYAYFPTSGIVSLQRALGNGSSAEIAAVGFEGVVGTSIFMGGGAEPSCAVMQSPVTAYRLPAGVTKNEFDRSGPVMHLMLRYTQALITQMTQTAVCNRHHSLEQQLCRWLLRSLDRLPDNQLMMTHQLISNMLGVRREGVTAAAQKLQTAGLIRYVRGRITVLDRQKLEQHSCECYQVVKKEYDRLLPDLEAI